MGPPILILHASGTNRDEEAAHAVALAGGDPRIIHVNELATGQIRFLDHAGVLLPGGFSYGDALGAGARLALELREWFGEELRQTVRLGRPILGICNGFQALVRAGLLTGSSRSDRRRQVTLAENQSGRFECRWVTLRIEIDSRASWLPDATQTIRCPVAHGEGRLAVSADEVIESMNAAGLVAFRYVTADGQPANGAYPDNPNGSVDDVAGITDVTGAVVGLMPHPEDHVVDWQRAGRSNGRSAGLGLPVFEAFVKAAQ